MRVGDLGDEDDVGAAGDAGGQRDMAGVAPHHLEDHDAVVARRGRLQPVERLGRDRDGGVVADRVLGRADIVVDGLGDADELDARPAAPAGAGWRSCRRRRRR